MMPAPFDWHIAKEYKPLVGEVVIIHQLYPPWAVFTKEGWRAVDRCGNYRSLSWQPEYWRREYHPQLPIGAAI